MKRSKEKKQFWVKIIRVTILLQLAKAIIDLTPINVYDKPQDQYPVRIEIMR